MLVHLGGDAQRYFKKNSCRNLELSGELTQRIPATLYAFPGRRAFL